MTTLPARLEANGATLKDSLGRTIAVCEGAESAEIAHEIAARWNANAPAAGGLVRTKLKVVASNLGVSPERIREVAATVGICLPAPGAGRRQPRLSFDQVMLINRELDSQMLKPTGGDAAMAKIAGMITRGEL